MFEQIFGPEMSLPARAVVALVLVLALIALTVWLMRRFGDGRITAGSGGRGRQQRLAVLDSTTVDARRRLVLIRRDNVEHLILIGGPTDVVIEPNIVRAQPASGVQRPAARAGGYDEDDATLIPDTPEPEPVRSAPAQPAPAPAAARAPAPRMPTEAPRPAAQPASQKLDPQYADMAQRLEAALRKPVPEPEVAQRATPSPRMPGPEPRPEPRIAEGPSPAPSAPSPRPMPRAPEARVEPRVETPRPQPAPAAAPRPAAQPAAAPTSADQAADVFASLEEEMASLLRPGAKKEPQK